MFSVVLSFLCFTLSFQPTDWEPMVSQEAVESRATLREEPRLTPIAERQMALEASTDAAIPLLRGYITSKVVFDTLSPDSLLSAWWQETILSNPEIIAIAISEMSSRYIVWDIVQWPAEHRKILPTYRVVLMEVLFETYLSTSTKAASLRDQIQKFHAIDMIPPEGWPLRTDPSVVRDPDLRKEYEQRLHELSRQDAVREELRRVDNALGQLEIVVASDVQLLYHAAKQSELLWLVEAIQEQGEARNKLCESIAKDWNDLKNMLETP